MIDTREALRLVSSALKLVQEYQSPPIAIALLREFGEPLIAVKMSETADYHLALAIDVAKTSRHLGADTESIAGQDWDMVRSANHLSYAPSYFRPIAGGVPLFADGLVVGAIGVSGLPDVGHELHNQALAHFVASLVPGCATAHSYKDYLDLKKKGLLKELVSK